jgi:hypothetical protein
MRLLLVFLVGMAAGAVLFHWAYLGLPPTGRCLWDHPLDKGARESCEQQATFKGYGTNARRQMDDLIGNLGQ